jgi:sialidase-1
MDHLVVVFQAGQDGCHTYRIPALAVTGSGRLLAFCEGRRNSWGDAGQIALVLKHSDDQGATWSPQRVVWEERLGAEEITIGNPCPLVDRRSGVVHLLVTRNNKRLFHLASADQGVTWSEPREHSAILRGFDYPVVRVGTGPCHGLQTRDGALVAPLWLCDGETSVKDRAYRSGVIRSDNGGATWSAGGLAPAVFPDLNECVAMEHQDGSLVLNMRSHAAGGCRALSESRDGGRTWSAPAREPGLPGPTCQASLLALGGGGALFSNPAATPVARARLTVRRSFDDGRTWAGERVLWPGPAAYSDLALLPGGDVVCLFECGEKHPYERLALCRFPADASDGWETSKG